VLTPLLVAVTGISHGSWVTTGRTYAHAHADDEEKMTLAITIAWHLAGNQTQRRLFAGAGVVQALAAALRWTLRTAVHADDDRTEPQTDGSSMAVGHRDALQLRALGTLAVFMIDKVSE